MTVKKKLLRFSKGQISPNLIERTDIGILDASGQKITNYYNSKYGALKSAPGTVLVNAWNGIKKLKNEEIKLADLSEGFICFNGTDHTISVYNNMAQLVSNISAAPWITEDNIGNITLAQNQDLILVTTGDNPIMQIDISSISSISSSVFSIPMSAILKNSNITLPSLSPVLFRMGTAGLPTDPAAVDIPVNALVYPNSGTADPDTSFPWTVQRLDRIGSLTQWVISSATINNLGTGYSVGDIVELGNGTRLQIATLTTGAALTLVDLGTIYDFNPSGTNLPTISSTGSGMTVNVTSANTTTVWTAVQYTPAVHDIIRDVFNSTMWEFFNNAWIRPAANQDTDYSAKWYNSALSGIVKITGQNNSILFTITAPAGISAESYANSVLIGTTFDGKNALGIIKISQITGTISGQNFQVRTISGLTLLAFDRNYTNAAPATGFTIRYSEQPLFSGDYPLTVNNPTTQENYPNSILFYQQRLIIGGSAYNRAQMIFSETGKYNSFIDEYLASSAFQLVIGSTEKEEIRNILLNQGIQIFTSNNEWLINDQAVTRSSGFIKNSSMGTNGVKPVIAANGTTLFVPKNGKGLIGFTYNFQSASYSTPYISLFTDVLDFGIVDILQKRGLDSTDDTLLYISMENGDLVVGNYLQEHEIQAFCKRANPNAAFRQTIQCDGNVIHTVDRNGNTGFELINESKYTEGSPFDFTYDPVAGIITPTTPSSYEGQTLNVYDGNRKFIGEFPVLSGIILLDGNFPAAISEIGYDIISEFGSNPQNISAETKTRYKSITAIRLALTADSNPDFLKVENKGYSWVKDGLAEYRRLVPPKRDCRFKIDNSKYPVEILSIEVEIEV